MAAEPKPCPVCGAPAGEAFLHAGEMPALLNVLCGDPRSARSLPRGTLRLALCGCGLVRNLDFDPALTRYDGAYENALHYSATFRRHAAALALGLAGRHRLAGGRVVEVGCGDGSFLVELVRAAGCEGVGFDPAHDRDRADLPPELPIRIHATFFSPGEAGRADLLCCRHILEHLEDPAGFLAGVGACLGPEGAFFCEVPDSLPTLRGEAVWDLIYEHCLYFTAPSMARLLEEAGFSLLRMESLYGGQFLTAEAGPGSRSRVPVPLPPPPPGELPALAAALPGLRSALLAGWIERLEEARRGGRTLALWGAGSKGVCFLNTLDRNCDRIMAAVDINPRKQGCFIAGTGHPVLAPEELRRDPPAGVIVLNPLYRDEVREALRCLGLASEVLTPPGAEGAA